MKKNLSKNKKILLVSSLLVVGTCIAGAIIYTQNNKTKSIVLENDTIVVEYGNKINVKVDDLVNADKDVLKDYKLNIDIENEPKKDYVAVGKYTGQIKYNNLKKDFNIEVKDTTKPKINNDTITIPVNSNEDTINKALDIEELSAYDVVINDEKLDYSKAGEYSVNVKVTDKYDNSTAKDLKVFVETKETANNDDKNDKDENTNTDNNGGSSNNNGSGSVSPTPNPTPTPPPVVEPEQPKPTPPPVIEPTPEPEVCVSDGNFGAVGNSGKVFYSIDEMYNWAFGFLESDENWNGPDYAGFNYWTVYDNCGERNDVWTVDFY